VSWSLTSLFSTNTARDEQEGGRYDSKTRRGPSLLDTDVLMWQRMCCRAALKRASLVSWVAPAAGSVD